MTDRKLPRTADERADNIRHLAAMIEDIEIAMLTTVATDGHLVSRPLGTQDAAFDGVLWFATEAGSGKAAEIRANPQVNVAYAAPGKNRYVSVAGRASLVDDRQKIDELWSPAMQLFFPDGKDDANLRLIRVEVESAEYWDGPGTVFGKALHFVLTAVTDDPDNSLSDNERFDLQR